EGNVELAAEMLGRNYMLNGTVVHGDKRGKQIGYPTANIKPEHPKKVIPKRGVYAVRVRVDGEWKGGMMNIGYRPTFEEEGVTLEVHIFNFDEEIYGKTVQVRFVKRLREEKKFDGVDELKTQLAEDEKQSRDILGEAS
ncbi:MAG: riboflavin kinase, partial [Balneolaceae bacterium]|nr:riboflavin kinase [Balneolaceae bacterium]